MAPVVISLIVAAIAFTGSVLAMCAARVLPDSHLTSDAKDVIKLGMALIATLVALVLGLMIATAKGTYDAEGANLRQFSANILLLDRVLSQYGPDTQYARELLRQGATTTLKRIWPEDKTAPAALAPGQAQAPMMAFLGEINRLSPENATEEFLKAQALRSATELIEARYELYVQAITGLPLPFFVVVVAWLVILFAGYGLIGSPNPTVLVFLLAVTLSVSGAVFLIQELATPFAGVVRLSSEPLRDVISLLGQ